MNTAGDPMLVHVTPLRTAAWLSDLDAAPRGTARPVAS